LPTAFILHSKKQGINHNLSCQEFFAVEAI